MVIVCTHVYLPELATKIANAMAGKPVDFAGYGRTSLADALMEAKRKRNYDNLLINISKFHRLTEEAFGEKWLQDSPKTADAINQAILEAEVAGVEFENIEDLAYNDGQVFFTLNTTEELIISRAKDILADREADDRDLMELE